MKTWVFNQDQLLGAMRSWNKELVDDGAKGGAAPKIVADFQCDAVLAFLMSSHAKKLMVKGKGSTTDGNDDQVADSGF